MRNLKITFLLLLSLILTHCTNVGDSRNDSLKDVAYDAFVYAYPLIEQVKTVNDMDKVYGPYGFGPNQVFMSPKYPMDNIGQPIVAPNFTSMTGLISIDISNGPVTVEIPDIMDRYAVFQFIDVFTYNFHYVGTRSTGGKGGKFILHNKFQDVSQSDATPILMEQTLANIIVRIDVKDKADVANVIEYQKRIKVSNKPAEVRAYPVYDKDKAFSPAFVDYINELIEWIPDAEKDMYKRFAKVGIKSDVKFSDEDLAQIQKGVDSAYTSIQAAKDNLVVGNGWTGATEVFGTRSFINGRYLDLAAGAYFGLWGNSKEEANYFMLFTSGEGELTFPKEDLPPLSDVGFYSLTIYDNTVHATKNKFNSYVLTMDRMEYADDGSLTFKISKEPQEGNWLYMPTDDFTLLLRVYAADSKKIEDYIPPSYKSNR